MHAHELFLAWWVWVALAPVLLGGGLLAAYGLFRFLNGQGRPWEAESAVVARTRLFPAGRLSRTSRYPLGAKAEVAVRLSSGECVEPSAWVSPDALPRLPVGQEVDVLVQRGRFWGVLGVRWA